MDVGAVSASDGPQVGEGQAVEHHWDGHHHAGEGTRGADVEQRVRGTDASRHDDHRAQRAEGVEHRQWQEVRQRSRHAVDARGDVVPELVGQQDREQGNGEGPGAGPRGQTLSAIGGGPAAADEEDAQHREGEEQRVRAPVEGRLLGLRDLALTRCGLFALHQDR